MILVCGAFIHTCVVLWLRVLCWSDFFRIIDDTAGGFQAASVRFVGAPTCVVLSY